MHSMGCGTDRIVTGDCLWLLADADLLAILGDSLAASDNRRRAGDDCCMDLASEAR